MYQINKHGINYFILILLLFFGSITLSAQQFDGRIESDRMTIEGVAREGFSTWFDFPAKVVEKSWWRYTRKFSRPLNMKTYYKVTIPSSENSGTVDIELLSKTMASKGGSKFFLTLNDANVPTEKKNAYTEQVKQLLLDFKQQYYIGLLEEKLEAAEKRAKKMSKEVDKSNSEKLIQQLMEEEQKMEGIREAMKKVTEG